MKIDLTSANINYLKITYRDNDDFSHCIKAAVRYINDFEIVASAKFDEYPKIQTPQDVELGIACDNGLYKANTRLLNTTQDNSYTVFSLKIPEDIDFQQNREFFRVKLHEDANIAYEENGELKQVSAITYDISANGVRIELDNNFDFPETVKIVLFLAQKTIEAKAKYIRTDNEDNVIKASFRFENIAQSDLDYISQICLQKQLEERRKNLM